jgi:hypothetical protein
MKAKDQLQEVSEQAPYRFDTLGLVALDVG